LFDFSLAANLFNPKLGKKVGRKGLMVGHVNLQAHIASGDGF